MDKCDEEEYTGGKAVSPEGRYYNSSALNLYIFCVLEIEIPIDDSQAFFLLKNVFLPINPRFSSIMVTDKNGVKRWKQVEVKLEEHFNLHVVPPSLPLESYDEYFDEYFSRIVIERPPQDKPLWEIHLVKYPRKNSSGALIFKLHHALGDGYTLMGALLSCLQRADNPSLPLTFPSTRKVDVSADASIWKKLCKLFPTVFNTVSDFGWTVLKSTLVEDDETPIRSGDPGPECRPCTISNISFPLDHVKQIKLTLGVTINDVITGIVFYGTRLYMQDIEEKSRKSYSTAMVMFNTRNIGAYQSIEEMLKPDTKGVWGNRISFLNVAIPEMTRMNHSDPLGFVREAHKLIKRKRNSLGVALTGKLLSAIEKVKGPEATARVIYKMVRNSSVVVSNLIGPVEQMALANHPVKDLSFIMSGAPESVTIGILSYAGKLSVTIKTEKDLIDSKKFKACMVHSFHKILDAARDVENKNSKA